MQLSFLDYQRFENELIEIVQEQRGKEQDEPQAVENRIYCLGIVIKLLKERQGKSLALQMQQYSG